MTLLVLFQIKHWVADYPLQRPWMLGKFLPGRAFVVPLAAHCVVNAAMTAAIVLAFGRWDLLWLAGFDFVCHFVMDRIKASPGLMGRWKALSASEYMGYRSMAEAESNHPEIVMARKSAIIRLKSNVYFWWCLGIDQGVHHLTHYAIIWWILQ